MAAQDQSRAGRGVLSALNDDFTVRPEAFPGVLADLARACGTPAAFRLARLAGGTRIYVPHRAMPDHRLTRELGREAAAWLAARYAGDYLRVPLARELLDWVEARALRARGLKHPGIARRIRRSQRSVERLLAGTPAGIETAALGPERPAPCPVCGHLARARMPRPSEPDPRQYTLPL